MRDLCREVPDPNGAGHTYFAAMEADGAVGSHACVPTPTVSFYDGEPWLDFVDAASAVQGEFLGMSMRIAHPAFRNLRDISGTD
jgi:hypothetical protein